jgi:hypothetical protein
MARSKKPLTIQEFSSRGGKARAKALTKQERQASAKKAAEARWAKKRKPEISRD